MAPLKLFSPMPPNNNVKVEIVPGQRSLSWDFCCCSCTGTKGQRDKDFFVSGQRNGGTRKLFCPKSHLILYSSLGNTTSHITITFVDSSDLKCQDIAARISPLSSTLDGNFNLTSSKRNLFMQKI